MKAEVDGALLLRLKTWREPWPTTRRNGGDMPESMSERASTYRERARTLVMRFRDPRAIGGICHPMIPVGFEEALAALLAEVAAEERDELYAHFTEVAVDAVKRAAAIRAREEP